MFSLNCRQYKITDEKTGETLKNFEIRKKDLIIADRAYVIITGMGYCLENGGDFILRIRFFAHSRCGKCTGISFADSTTIDVCNSHRIQQHRVFKDIAQRGKSSTGWFYGFKLHISINDRGEILNFCLTCGNKDDRNHEFMGHLTKNIFGKLFADKGYISKKLAGQLQKMASSLLQNKKEFQNQEPYGIF